MIREPDKIIDLKQLKEMVPFSAMQFWRMERDGTFPRRVKLGPSRVGWSLREVESWIEERKRERDDSLRISGLGGRDAA